MVGAILQPDGVVFRVWAMGHGEVELVLYDADREAASHRLTPEEGGYFSLHLQGLRAGARYKFRVDGAGPFPDPASRAQPDGVHGPSEVVDLGFEWSDRDWKGYQMDRLVIYELHVGAATLPGTFDSLIPILPNVKALGANAIELMPVADFPGRWNWGYDGVDLWAPAQVYGGPRALQRLVDAAHSQGLAVILDVVYNHLGPDGNYLRAYSDHYFTDRHRTPWGEAINFDGPHARPVQDFFLANAIYWLREFHLDGLRLDATHEIKDDSELHFLRELSERVRADITPERRVVLIAENDLNDVRLITPVVDGGLGLDGVWADDLHHQLRRAFAGDHEGYYADYSGTTTDIAQTLRRGWFFEGQPRSRTGQPWGIPAGSAPYWAFIHCIQNHDQVGNRAFGGRLNHDVDPAAYRAASTLLLLDPATPLLFMGQEWAASTPFLYFTDHDPELGRLVTEGRRAEFAAFSTFAADEMREKIPDPQAIETFQRSKLNWEERELPQHDAILLLYHDLLALRRNYPALRNRSRDSIVSTAISDDALIISRSDPGGEILLLVLNLRGTREISTDELEVIRALDWRLRFSSEARRYGGSEGIRLEGLRLIINGPGAAVLEAQGVKGE